MIVLLATPPSYDELLVVLATWVLRGCTGWAALIGLAALVEAATSGRVHATTWVATPPAVRRALLAGLGVLLAGALPGPVSAAVVIGSAHRPHPADHPAGHPAGEPLALPVPERPEGRAEPSAVRVRAGDTLWGLAASRLPRGADDGVVLAAVHRWHARNHHVIGPDPDLLRPGQRLVPPRHRPTEESR